MAVDGEAERNALVLVGKLTMLLQLMRDVHRGADDDELAEMAADWLIRNGIVKLELRQ